MTDSEYIESFFAGVSTIIEKISRTDIERMIEAIFGIWKSGNCIYLVGNGGSAGTASHFAADLSKCTACEGRPRLKAISLVENVALVSAIINDEGWEHVFVEQLKTHFRAGDAVLALSVHGGSGSDRAGPWSQNLLSALRFARENGGTALGFSGFDGGPMKEIADVCVVVPYNTTPHVEAFHVVLHHLIAFRLRELVRDFNPAAGQAPPAR